MFIESDDDDDDDDGAVDEANKLDEDDDESSDLLDVAVSCCFLISARIFADFNAASRASSAVIRSFLSFSAAFFAASSLFKGDFDGFRVFGFTYGIDCTVNVAPSGTAERN